MQVDQGTLLRLDERLNDAIWVLVSSGGVVAFDGCEPMRDLKGTMGKNFWRWPGVSAGAG